MHITDPVADMLTRIRNANSAKHSTVDVPASNMKKAIAKILLDEGYVKNYQLIDDGLQGVIRFQARPACLRGRGRTAQSPARTGHRDRIHLEGRHDRQVCSCSTCRR